MHTFFLARWATTGRAVALLLTTAAALLGGAPAACAQAPVWDQAVGLNPANTANHQSGITAIATDTDGNRYVTGSFNGTATFGATVLTTTNAFQDAFVAKLDTAGVWQWAVPISGTGVDLGNGVAVAGSGATAEVYITGFVTGNAGVGTVPLVGGVQGGLDAYVAKLSAATGAVQWATHLGGTNNDIGYAVAVAGSGATAEVYVTGYFTGSGTFGTRTLTAAGDADAYVARLTGAGAVQWAVSAGGPGFDSGFALAVAPAPGGLTDVFVTGAFSNTASFGSFSLTSAGEVDAFVARLSANGGWQWVRGAGGPLFDNAIGVAVAGSGATPDVYVVGVLRDSTTFGPFSVNSAGDADAFVARLSVTGTWQWVTRAGGTAFDYASAVAVAGNGSTASIYATGAFSGNTAFGAFPLVSSGNNDVFVTRLSAAGAIQWASRAGSSTTDDGIAVALAGSGATATVSVGGFVGSGATFGPRAIAGTGSLGYVARLRDPLPLGVVEADLPPARLTLWPNPTATRTLHLIRPAGTSATAPVEVRDALGRVVSRSVPTTDGTFDARGLPPGVYTVRVGTATARLVLD